MVDTHIRVDKKDAEKVRKYRDAIKHDDSDDILEIEIEKLRDSMDRTIEIATRIINAGYHAKMSGDCGKKGE
jgi:hypothetical protein